MPNPDAPPITLRAAMLAAHVSDLAGQRVRIANARVVGVFDARAFLIDSPTIVPPAPGNRDRVLVLVGSGALSVAPRDIVSDTVTVIGMARTLIGMRVSREVPWPAPLDRRLVERLDVRAAVLATSVRTAEGIELTSRP